eukprot:13103753-Ditylum_brightwellii.AAC.1
MSVGGAGMGGPGSGARIQMGGLTKSPLPEALGHTHISDVCPCHPANGLPSAFHKTILKLTTTRSDSNINLVCAEIGATGTSNGLR